ncbi:MAG: 3-deoxy-manno-octulosonate cytidylyltransferase [Deltaproteobacteria bacterium]
MNIVCIIPSRYASSRFVGKPLADICGKPMIQRVYERVRKSDIVSRVLVSTDDVNICKAVEAFGGEVVLSSAKNRSGTDRVAESATAIGLNDEDIIINIQGDQPLFDPRQINEVVQPLIENETIPMATLIYKIHNEAEVTHQNAVKTVVNANGFAVYFSRATIPFVRDVGNTTDYYKHHGIYAYRKWFLDIFAKLPTGNLEKLEALEQLRAIEYGYPIKIVISKYDSLEVDTPAELEEVKKLFYEK